MHVLSWPLIAAAWIAWLYPLLFRAPHQQNRPSITLPGPTRAGLALQCAGIAMALLFRAPLDTPVAAWRVIVGAALAAICTVMSWTSVTHLGRQFRITAGLYEDHLLVSTGPYRWVRHPLYTSMLGMVVVTILLLMTELVWAAAALAFYIVGTEIRVHAEDALLRSRFGQEFERYRRGVKGYIPFVR